MISEFIKDLIKEKYVPQSIIIGLIITGVIFGIIIVYSLNINDLYQILGPVLVLLIAVFVVTFLFITSVCYLIIFSLANWKEEDKFRF